MKLVGIQRKAPDRFIVLDQEGDVAHGAGWNRVGEEIPHFARIAAVTWYLELNLANDPVAREFISTTEREPEAQQYVSIANYATSAKVQAEDREGHEGFRLWNVLVTQLCKPVVKTLPGPDSPPVQIQALKLPRCTRELRIRLRSEEAHPITMVIGDVPNRGPAV